MSTIQQAIFGVRPDVLYRALAIFVLHSIILGILRETMCSALEIVSLFYSTGSDEEMYLGVDRKSVV